MGKESGEAQERCDTRRVTDGVLLSRVGSFLNFRKSLDGCFEEPAELENPLRVAATMRDFLIRRLLKVRSKKRGLALMQLNRAQLEFSRRCSKRNIVLKARQLGMTTYIAARYFVQTITQPGTLTVQVAHNQESAEEIFRIVHRFWENLPEGIKHGALDTSRANVRQIVFPRIDSEYRVEAADENAGRGLTIHNLHCSEVARWTRGASEALASLRAAVAKDGEIVLESTPNGAGGLFYEEWQRAEETGYTRHFFPWWYGEGYEISAGPVDVQPLTEEELALVAEYGLTDRQIAFRRQIRSQLRGFAAQEFAEDAVSCFRASGECVFDMDAIDKALLECGEAVETRENHRLSVWFPPQPGKEYIVGVDPAGGGCEGDYSCAEVIDRLTGMQCAELYGHFPPKELAKRVAELGTMYNEALVAVERNNHGHAVLALLNDMYAHLYREGTGPASEGWLTNAVTRPAMIENLATILAIEPRLFHSPVFLGECRTFVRQIDGDTGAAPGAHDDSVMAMAIAFAVRRAAVGRDVEKPLEMASLDC
jgi:hypothetical protein